jgi:hypothetical protein
MNPNVSASPLLASEPQLNTEPTEHVRSQDPRTPRQSESLRNLATRLWHLNRPLSFVGFAHVALAIIALALLILDPRMLTGQLIWVKPLKFSISIAAYTLTLAWLLSHVEGRRRWIALISWGTAIGFTVEIVAIVTQVIRGVRSHFNFLTPLDAALYGAMGAFVILIWLMNLVAAGLLLRQPFQDRALAWSLRLALVITAFGAFLGYQMVNQRTPEQLARAEAGLPMVEAGGHSFGVADGGAGMPFTGWSTEAGDIRVAHFVGLHAMQVLPLFGIALTRRRRKRGLRGERERLILVWAAGIAYLGMTMVLAWQALRGQSVVAPDALTLGALALALGLPALGGLTGVAALRKRTVQ